MSKYIDAEKLKALIREWYNAFKLGAHGLFRNGKVEAFRETIELIESLQQEQPGLPGIEHPGIPGKDYIPVEWVDACEEYGKWKIVKQEQPECSGSLVDVDAVREDFIKEVYRVLDADPTNDRANAIIDAFDSLPIVSKQPEVDLEKEIDTFLNETGAPYVWCNDDEQKEWCNIIARHFYELGNARKDKLPEIELDKFIDKVDTFKARYKHPESIAINGAMAFMARMFYQYPNVARQWYEQLSKATMD